MCQGGTTCVATGQDRRLGDFFTNALDARGCVLIATGDTQLPDPVTGAQQATSRPVYIAQTSGPGLTGQDCTPVPAVSSGGTAGSSAPASSSTASTSSSGSSGSSTANRSLAATGRSTWPLAAGLALLVLALGVRRLRRPRRR